MMFLIFNFMKSYTIDEYVCDLEMAPQFTIPSIAVH